MSFELRAQGVKLPPSGSSSSLLHIEVVPAPPAAATAQATARRILSGVRVQYIPSGQVARRLHMSSRTLGKLTGRDPSRPCTCQSNAEAPASSAESARKSRWCFASSTQIPASSCSCSVATHGEVRKSVTSGDSVADAVLPLACLTALCKLHLNIAKQQSWHRNTVCN